MLKIRDDVDLKELGKFKMFLKDSDYIFTNKYDIPVCTVFAIDREIDILADNNGVELLYDLIQAGLDEKVRE